jgi:hypothetical protein
MADKIKFELEGFAEFEKQLLDLAEGYRSDLVARNTLVKATKRALVPVWETASVMAPYDVNRKSDYDSEGNKKPHLRETVRIDARIPYETDKMSEFVMDTDAVIGMVSVKKSAVSLSQEFGNATTVAQPYLRPALESNIPKVLAILKSELSNIIPAYAKSLRRRGIK